MSAYFDTSALIRAWRLGLQPKGITRAHALAEFYCVLTGPGLAVVREGKTFKLALSPADALAAAQETFQNLDYHRQTGTDTLAALEWAVKENVQGRAIHDYLHCDAAEAANATVIVTLNVREFSRLTTKKVVSPEAHFVI